ncbi:uncharacterized protein BDR25DRAFT_319889 [Lindgomyces ingoldianus]|uniref:Uncharacterized protein n=1 Tax=Lindgomyces ingoldianus TaxID=673940 RepID=A0ACB6Q9C8_9PLEO|nr:uncharacterized protein BDR25DRAFT_319889 [Lindgomyces ingoldianus]KAF2463509.1 hypothetical protein BDR25DRAFT_319889 [Lindgomyces ingoldianus]
MNSAIPLNDLTPARCSFEGQLSRSNTRAAQRQDDGEGNEQRRSTSESPAMGGGGPIQRRRSGPSSLEARIARTRNSTSSIHPSRTRTTTPPIPTVPGAAHQPNDPQCRTTASPNLPEDGGLIDRQPTPIPPQMLNEGRRALPARYRHQRQSATHDVTPEWQADSDPYRYQTLARVRSSSSTSEQFRDGRPTPGVNSQAPAIQTTFEYNLVTKEYEAVTTANHAVIERAARNAERRKQQLQNMEEMQNFNNARRATSPNNIASTNMSFSQRSHSSSVSASVRRVHFDDQDNQEQQSYRPQRHPAFEGRSVMREGMLIPRPYDPDNEEPLDAELYDDAEHPIIQPESDLMSPPGTSQEPPTAYTRSKGKQPAIPQIWLDTPNRDAIPPNAPVPHNSSEGSHRQRAPSPHPHSILRRPHRQRIDHIPCYKRAYRAIREQPEIHPDDLDPPIPWYKRAYRAIREQPQEHGPNITGAAFIMQLEHDIAPTNWALHIFQFISWLTFIVLFHFWTTKSNKKVAVDCFELKTMMYALALNPGSKSLNSPGNFNNRSLSIPSSVEIPAKFFKNGRLDSSVCVLSPLDKRLTLFDKFHGQFIIGMGTAVAKLHSPSNSPPDSTFVVSWLLSSAVNFED